MAGEVHYIDGVGRVTVVNGLAHIDIVAVVPPTQEGAPPQAAVTHRFVMGLPQYVRMCSEMAGHLTRMEEKGLITRQGPLQS
jgi:hypothetical protein